MVNNTNSYTEQYTEQLYIYLLGWPAVLADNMGIILLFLFQCDIEVHHDVEQRIIYLHLVSVYDTTRLAQLCEHIHSHPSNTVSVYRQETKHCS